MVPNDPNRVRSTRHQDCLHANDLVSVGPQCVHQREPEFFNRDQLVNGIKGTAQTSEIAGIGGGRKIPENTMTNEIALENLREARAFWSFGVRREEIALRNSASSAVIIQSCYLVAFDLTPVAAQDECGPVKWWKSAIGSRGLVIVQSGEAATAVGSLFARFAEHLELGFAKCFELSHLLLPEVLVETRHQYPRYLVVYFPQAGDCRAGAGNLKRPLQTQESFAAGHLA